METQATPADTLAQNDIRDRWNGVWIWPDDVAVDRNAYALFRKTFDSRCPASLTIAVTANHVYSLYLDSQFVGRGPVRGHLRFYPFDSITLSVEPGEIAAGLIWSLRQRLPANFIDDGLWNVDHFSIRTR